MSDDWDSDGWLAEHMPGLMEVQGLMAERLSDNPARLYEQLSKVEAWHSRINTMLADANARLDLAEYQAMMNLPGELKVDDKRICLRHAVANERRLRDILKGLADSIKNRCMLGMNLRNSNAGERSDY
jgi:hypothetical protein